MVGGLNWWGICVTLIVKHSRCDLSRQSLCAFLGYAEATIVGSTSKDVLTISRGVQKSEVGFQRGGSNFVCLNVRAWSALE